MTRIKRLLGVLIGFGGVGFWCSCSAGATTGPVDGDVRGEWQEPGLFPGSAFEMTLSATAGIVTGGGAFAVEAGAGGTLAIAGTVRDDSLHLRVIFLYDPRFPGIQPDTASFEGLLSARDTIHATLTRQGIAESVLLVRLPLVGDPH